MSKGKESLKYSQDAPKTKIDINEYLLRYFQVLNILLIQKSI